MREDQLDEALTERWGEHQRLLEGGAFYSAMVRLGEIENCLRTTSPSNPLVQKWHPTVMGVQLTEELLLTVHTQAREQVDRLARMLDIGSTFTYEELVLAVTIRTELDLLLGFLRSRSIQPELDLRRLDSDILEVMSSTRNASAFQSARSAARRNWGLPIRSSWLEGVAEG